ncbi:FecR domain-containing protein [Luteimonas sp. Y-2-2-4F]|nr:FecR domain-containing protein [Luteimonas sp. Y-2-2-4F]MCD9033167.1 FecR domain-containing protein [Luteimonas sp. Y-2-2-4F]
MASSAEIERAAAGWLARRESGWSAAEQAAFQAWREASTAHRIAWIRVETGWQRAARLNALGAGLPPGEVPPPGAWPELSGAGEATAAPAVDLRDVVFRAPRRRRLPRWPAAAAAALLAAVGLAGWWQFGGVERAEYATALGETRRVELADGSVVLLNSDSHVDVVYSRRERSLRLVQGEAFFEVAPNPDRPFAVEADARRVVAVGTRFAVRRGDGGLRVAVAEGRVHLQDAAQPGTAPTRLIAGMVAVARRDGVQLRQRSVGEVEDLLSWREGMLVFRSTPLAEAVAEFNRYNAHKLVVDDPSIADIPVGGGFRWANTEAFVRVLEQSFGLHAERGDDETRLRAE